MGNPNPARITDQMWALWEGGCQLLAPGSELGGFYALKKGYHSTRTDNQQNWPGNYSYADYEIDRLGPGDKSAGFDWTFPEAQGKADHDYTRIALFSQRLLAAGRAGRDADPRTIYMREFYGNADWDLEVEGWDFAGGFAASSDSSHLWHIHISVHRGYVGDPEMTRAILSILRGETVEQWRGNTSEDHMLTIVKDSKNVAGRGKDTLFLCDGLWAKQISPDDIGFYQDMAKQGAIALWHSGEVWDGYGAIWGVVITEGGASTGGIQPGDTVNIAGGTITVGKK